MSIQILEDGVDRCQWLVSGYKCNAILTEDSAYQVFHAYQNLKVCGNHKKLQQSLESLDKSYIAVDDGETDTKRIYLWLISKKRPLTRQSKA